MEAGVAEGTGAAGAHPVAAAVVGLVLLPEALFEQLLKRLQVEVLHGGGEQPPLLVAEARHGERV